MPYKRLAAAGDPEVPCYIIGYIYGVFETQGHRPVSREISIRIEMVILLVGLRLE